MAQDELDDKVRFTGSGPADNAEDLAALDAENASLRDRLLRSLADAENTRRRAERSTADARQYAISDFAAELLAVVDNLQRAIALGGGSAGTDALGGRASRWRARNATSAPRDAQSVWRTKD